MITQAMIHEALRYIGIHKGCKDEEIEQRVYETFKWLEEHAKIRSINSKLEISVKQDEVYIKNTSLSIESKDLSKLLKNSSHIYIMAVTLGKEIDMQIALMQKKDMLDAVILDACASVYIDKACDDIESKIMEKLNAGEFLTMRFSPGYGDVPLEISEDILQILQAPKRIGLTLTKTHMLFPTKSITAFIGISSQKENRQKTCGACNLVKTCAYRKRGDRCGV